VYSYTLPVDFTLLHFTSNSNITIKCITITIKGPDRSSLDGRAAEGWSWPPRSI